MPCSSFFLVNKLQPLGSDVCRFPCIVCRVSSRFSADSDIQSRTFPCKKLPCKKLSVSKASTQVCKCRYTLEVCKCPLDTSVKSCDFFFSSSFKDTALGVQMKIITATSVRHSHSYEGRGVPSVRRRERARAAAPRNSEWVIVAVAGGARRRTLYAIMEMCRHLTLDPNAARHLRPRGALCALCAPQCSLAR